MDFAGAHILSVEQFERSDIERIFTVADRMAPYAHRERITKVLDGAILGSMFFGIADLIRGVRSANHLIAPLIFLVLYMYNVLNLKLMYVVAEKK